MSANQRRLGSGAPRKPGLPVRVDLTASAETEPTAPSCLHPGVFRPQKISQGATAGRGQGLEVKGGHCAGSVGVCGFRAKAATHSDVKAATF
jgi:hypothetical protein